MKEWFFLYKRLVIITVVLIILMLLSFNLLFSTQENDDSMQALMDITTDTPTTSSDESMSKETKPKQVLVDIKGEVNSPGVYEGVEGERVKDIIDRAGGLTDEADLYQINLAMHIEDAMVIIIPKKGEQITTLTPNALTSSSSDGKVNINSADEALLMTLPNIGPSKATAIIQYRTENGPFKTIEDLKSISGIGEKTFEKLKEHIKVN